MRILSLLALPVALASTTIPQLALAADGPGCFPEVNWTESFLNGQVDPNNHLLEGEWDVIANGRLHTLEVLEIDAAAGWFFGYYNGEAIQGSWSETERAAAGAQTLGALGGADPSSSCAWPRRRGTRRSCR